MHTTAKPSDNLEFAAWYATNAAELTNRIIALVGDPVLGREVAAEAFARAFERWGRVRRMKSPEGWVFQTARNLWRKSWRRRGIERRALAKVAAGETHVSTPDQDATDILVAGSTPEQLSAAVEQLPERMQVAVRLRYWDQLSEAQVAERMNISVGTVSAMLSQGRSRLRQGLAQQTAEKPVPLENCGSRRTK